VGAAVEAGNSIDIDRPEVGTKPRGHRPIDRHRAFSVGIPTTITFLHARTASSSGRCRLVAPVIMTGTVHRLLELAVLSPSLAAHGRPPVE